MMGVEQCIWTFCDVTWNTDAARLIWSLNHTLLVQEKKPLIR
jgi:hypothetical protein